MYEHTEEGRSEAAGAKQATPTAEGAIGEDNDGLWQPRSSRGLTASTSGGCLWLTTWTVCGQSLRDPSFRHLDSASVCRTDRRTGQFAKGNTALCTARKRRAVKSRN